ncbi:MAG: hypothetical protein Alpg2KO_17710 [Alphaproteobacteria bacterium]
MLYTALKYGLPAGALAIGLIILHSFVVGTEYTGSEQVIGYAIIFLCLLAIPVGIARYRAQHVSAMPDHRFTFGHGTVAGIGISVAATVAYVIGWEIWLAATDYAFIAQFAEGVMELERARGASAAELAELQANMDQMVELYSNPLIRPFLSALEILPAGLLVSLLSALLLRKSAS